MSPNPDPDPDDDDVDDLIGDEIETLDTPHVVLLSVGDSPDHAAAGPFRDPIEACIYADHLLRVLTADLDTDTDPPIQIRVIPLFPADDLDHQGVQP
jgi:hypothetical protein